MSLYFPLPLGFLSPCISQSPPIRCKCSFAFRQPARCKRVLIPPLLSPPLVHIYIWCVTFPTTSEQSRPLPLYYDIPILVVSSLTLLPPRHACRCMRRGVFAVVVYDSGI